MFAVSLLPRTVAKGVQSRPTARVDAAEHTGTFFSAVPRYVGSLASCLPRQGGSHCGGEVDCAY